MVGFVLRRDILDYLRREMIGPNGEIFLAEDADSAESEGAIRKKEGAFYVWTSREVEDIIGEHTNLFKGHYYIKSTGNCDLSSTSAMASKFGMPVEKYLEILGMCRQKLFDSRSKRPRPHLDDNEMLAV